MPPSPKQSTPVSLQVQHTLLKNWIQVNRHAKDISSVETAQRWIRQLEEEVRKAVPSHAPNPYLYMSEVQAVKIDISMAKDILARHGVASDVSQRATGNGHLSEPSARSWTHFYRPFRSSSPLHSSSSTLYSSSSSLYSSHAWPGHNIDAEKTKRTVMELRAPLETTVRHYKNENDKLKQTVKDLESQLAACTANAPGNAALKKENEQLKQTVKDLESRLATDTVLKNENEELRRTLGTLEQTVKELKSQPVAKAPTLTTCKLDIGNAEVEETLKQKLDMLQQKVKVLETQLASNGSSSAANLTNASNETKAANEARAATVARLEAELDDAKTTFSTQLESAWKTVNWLLQENKRLGARHDEDREAITKIKAAAAVIMGHSIYPAPPIPPVTAVPAVLATPAVPSTTIPMKRQREAEEDKKPVV